MTNLDSAALEALLKWTKQLEDYDKTCIVPAVAMDAIIELRSALRQLLSDQSATELEVEKAVRAERSELFCRSHAAYEAHGDVCPLCEMESAESKILALQGRLDCAETIVSATDKEAEIDGEGVLPNTANKADTSTFESGPPRTPFAVCLCGHTEPMHRPMCQVALCECNGFAASLSATDKAPIMRAVETEPSTVADQRDGDLAIPMAALEREWVEHAARLRNLPLVEYVRRAINLSLMSEGVDAVLLAQSDDDGPCACGALEGDECACPALGDDGEDGVMF